MILITSRERWRAFVCHSQISSIGTRTRSLINILIKSSTWANGKCPCQSKEEEVTCCRITIRKLVLTFKSWNIEIESSNTMLSRSPTMLFKNCKRTDACFTKSRVKASLENSSPIRVNWVFSERILRKKKLWKSTEPAGPIYDRLNSNKKKSTASRLF